MIVLLLGPDSIIGSFEGIGFKVVYAFPGMVIATLFVTFPLMVREVMPVLQEMEMIRNRRRRRWGLTNGQRSEGNMAFHPVGCRIWPGTHGGPFIGRVWCGAGGVR